MSTTDTALIKKPHSDTMMDVAQMEDFAKCLHPTSGPSHFMENHFFIQHPTRGKIKYAPFPYQRKLIDVYHQNRFSISMLSRQTGKCVRGDTTFINIKNKHTGEVKRVSLEYFYEMQEAARRSQQI